MYQTKHDETCDQANRKENVHLTDKLIAVICQCLVFHLWLHLCV